jgi:hypothetical protein
MARFLNRARNINYFMADAQAVVVAAATAPANTPGASIVDVAKAGQVA